MKRKTYRVEVVFPFDPDSFRRISDAVELAVGYDCDGSGAGFGERDMSFYCGSFKKAQKIFDKAVSKLSTMRNMTFSVNLICER